MTEGLAFGVCLEGGAVVGADFGVAEAAGPGADCGWVGGEEFEACVGWGGAVFPLCGNVSWGGLGNKLGRLGLTSVKSGHGTAST